MFKEIKDKLSKLSNLQKILLAVVVVLIIWFLYTRMEKLEGNSNSVVITNEPNNNQDATELKEVDPVLPVLYDRKTGLITAASEFIGLPKEILPASGNKAVTNYGKIDRLDDGYNGAMGLNYNMCSKSCCSPQYPPPFNLEDDALVAKMKDKFVPNNYGCNNAWNNSGCVCMTKEQHEYHSSRGGNA